MSSKKFRVIKPEIRVLGVDDGAFVPHTKGYAPIVGAVFRGGYWLDGVLATKVEIDGFDATSQIAKMIDNSPHHKQLRVVMLDGVTVAGFNVVDIKRLSILTGLPVIAVTRDKPDFTEIRKALKHLPGSLERWKAVLDAGEIIEVQTRRHNKKVFMEVSGMSVEDATKVLRMTATRSNMPEALRVAHMIASATSHI